MIGQEDNDGGRPNEFGTPRATMMAAGAVSAGAGSPAKASAGKQSAVKKTAAVDEKIHCWPFLVRVEFLVAMGVMVLLTVWSLTVDAPLEEPANTTRTPNPSKAPWYFLGL
jgi:hypothetical protein